jgi:predicted DNA-binding protein (MmcQ/YjbR family)
MNVEWVRRFCMGLPHATETVQWEDNLVFKIGGKMFAVAALEPNRVWLSFKCTAEDFAQLTERNGIVPAPYLARASWVALEDEDALRGAELQRYLLSAYELVLAKLPRKVRRNLA